jgi:NAD(P)-dependent dehydrogenase (short-subunit alcohol dehydrogenase family)
MRRALRDAVVVLTGATSGIGRAAARELARRGAILVLAARNTHVLREVVRECQSFGARALAVPTDVRDEAAVRELARCAVEAFGRIDVWVNNAGVALYAPIEDAPYDVYRGVIETNLLGCVHGARAVLPYFKRQGSGVLINNASMLGKVGEKYLSAYVASKFGVVGLGNALRQDLVDNPDIHVCTLLPASLDTPLLHHAGNYTRRALQPLPPLYSADRAARAIASLAEQPQREKHVGIAGPVLEVLHVLAPGLMEQIIARYSEKMGIEGRPAKRTAGNILTPVTSWMGVSGGYPVARGLAAMVEHLQSAAQIAMLVPAVAVEQITRRMRKIRD